MFRYTQPIQPGCIRSATGKIAALAVLTMMMLNLTACGPAAVPVAKFASTQLVGTLVGAAVQKGALKLVTNKLVAQGAAAAAEIGAQYVIEELVFNANGQQRKLENVSVTEGKPIPIQFDGEDQHAYLFVARDDARLQAAVNAALANLEPTCLLSFEPIEPGRFTLSWNSHNATSASLNGETVKTQGSKEVTVSQNQTFTLEVFGRKGKDTSTVTLQGTTPADAQGDLTLEKFVVYEDGSIGATTWEFDVFVDNQLALTIPQQSLHDDGNEQVVTLNRTIGLTLSGASGLQAQVSIRARNRDGGADAVGNQMIDLNSTGNREITIPVSVPNDQKKGSFVFYFTISRR